MEKTIINHRSFKEKVSSLWYKTKRKVKEGTVIVRDNLDIIIPLVPVACTIIGVATKITSKMIQKHNTNKEIDFRQRTIYDRSLGRYVELSRPLTTEQAIIIEERRANGEKLTNILDSMKLLKSIR